MRSRSTTLLAVIATLLPVAVAAGEWASEIEGTTLHSAQLTTTNNNANHATSSHSSSAAAPGVKPSAPRQVDQANTLPDERIWVVNKDGCQTTKNDPTYNAKLSALGIAALGTSDSKVGCITTHYLEQPYDGDGTLGVWNEAHAGIDLRADNTSVYSITDGTVRSVNLCKVGPTIGQSACQRANKKDVNEEHSTLVVEDDARTVKILYLHMSSIDVEEGARITAGMKLGTAGSVATRAAHLHLEVVPNEAHTYCRSRALGGSACPKKPPRHHACLAAEVRALTMDAAETLAVLAARPGWPQTTVTRACGLFPVPIKRGGHWGFVDEEGETVIPFQFDDLNPRPIGNGDTVIGLGPFRTDYPHLGELIAVKLGAKWGFVNREGRMTIPPKFDEVGDCSFFLPDYALAADCFEHGPAPVRSGLKWGYVNASGEMATPFAYDGAAAFTGGGVARVRIGKHWGLVDRHGQWVAHPEFLNLRTMDRLMGLFEGQSGTQWGVIDSKGQLVLDLTAYDATAARPFEGVWAVRRRDATNRTEQWEFIDTAGKSLPIPRSADSQIFSEGLTVVQVSGRFGYMNKSGAFAIRPQFQWATSFHEGLASASMAKPSGYIDSGKPFGYIDKNGLFVIKPQFENSLPFRHGVAQVKVGGKWGYINRQGEIIVKPLFERVGDFHGERARAVLDGKEVIIDKTGKVVWNGERE